MNGKIYKGINSANTTWNNLQTIETGLRLLVVVMEIKYMPQ